MFHISDGTLRRLYDEPANSDRQVRAHIDSCSRCAERYRSVVADARAAGDMLAAVPFAVDTRGALSRVHQRLASAAPSAAVVWSMPWNERIRLALLPARERLVRPLASLAGVVALIGTLALTPAGSWAQGVLTVFAPQQLVVISVSSADMRSLAHLSNYGTMQMPAQPGRQFANSAASAAVLAGGLPVLTPRSLPAGVPSSVSYGVMPARHGSFTFSAAKAQATAARLGERVPPMPPGMDGSTLVVTVGPSVIATYGGPAQVHALNPAGHVGKTTRGGGAPATVPPLTIGELKAPVVTSSGVSTAELEQYVLAQPGISPQLVAAIKGITSPGTTLPIPVPVGSGETQAVSVQGVSGIELSDPTGINGIVWEKNGVIYGVGGTLSSMQLLAIANSLG